jgi:hypothetical protein
MIVKSIINQIKILNFLNWILKLFLFHRIFYVRFKETQLEKHGNLKQYSYFILYFFFRGSTNLVEIGLVVVEVSISHLDTPPSVVLLWTSDRPIAVTSPRLHTTLTSEKSSIPPAEFEPAIIESDWPQTHALDPPSHIWIYIFQCKYHWGEITAVLEHRKKKCWE